MVCANPSFMLLVLCCHSVHILQDKSHTAHLFFHQIIQVADVAGPWMGIGSYVFLIVCSQSPQVCLISQMSGSPMFVPSH